MMDLLSASSFRYATSLERKLVVVLVIVIISLMVKIRMITACEHSSQTKLACQFVIFQEKKLFYTR